MPPPTHGSYEEIREYIKANKLQNSVNKHSINADAKLKPIFGKDQTTIFETHTPFLHISAKP